MVSVKFFFSPVKVLVLKEKEFLQTILTLYWYMINTKTRSFFTWRGTDQTVINLSALYRSEGLRRDLIYEKKDENRSRYRKYR